MLDIDFTMPLYILFVDVFDDGVVVYHLYSAMPYIDKLAVWNFQVEELPLINCSVFEVLSSEFSGITAFDVQ